MSAETVAAESGSPTRDSPAIEKEIIHRHSLMVRITHWLNFVFLALLLMSGLQIFNAHARLYWGRAGADADRPWLEMLAVERGANGPEGVTRIGGVGFDTTGVLGVSKAKGGALAERGFPAWATLPSWRDLATGRRWHFFLAWCFVANGLAYLGFGLLSGHFHRDLAPRRGELAPTNLGRSLLDHLRLKHPQGEAARRYNVLQQLAYAAVIFVLLPLMVLTGLSMSPAIDAVVPWLVPLFGGRQSARSLHFICANLIVLFVLVHVIEVLLAGVVNEMRSMITGRFVIHHRRGP
ncbi:MAG: cytochrome b/b6 domain-containing protein [Caulobacteraceae bacterium]